MFECTTDLRLTVGMKSETYCKITFIQWLCIYLYIYNETRLSMKKIQTYVYIQTSLYLFNSPYLTFIWFIVQNWIPENTKSVLTWVFGEKLCGAFTYPVCPIDVLERKQQFVFGYILWLPFIHQDTDSFKLHQSWHQSFSVLQAGYHSICRV